MRIQTVVQHHPARAHLLPSLLAALPEGAAAVTDPGADDARRSPWRAYLQCLRSLDETASHLLVVQDDVELCLDFAEAAGQVARSVPSDPVALFTPGLGSQRRAILAACADNRRYAELPHRNTFVPCVCVLWPRASVESILEWAQHAGLPDTMTADDGCLGRWAEATGARILATVPSLAEHPDRERSLVGKHAMAGRNPARIAACWAGDMSGLEFDW